MRQLSRRDLLKLSLAALGGAAAARLAPFAARNPSNGRPNILLLVFDALSARHMSLYGYARATTPNLEAFAETAAVYHDHYSAGSFTTPGTASILTGLEPWHHRAVALSSPVKRSLSDNNIFRLGRGEYTRIGFAQNLLADVFLRQFHRDLDLRLPAQSFSYGNPLLIERLNPSDPLAYFAFDDFLVGGFKFDTPYSGSAMLGVMDRILRRGVTRHPEIKGRLRAEVCFNGYFYYQNRVLFDGIFNTLKKAATGDRPYLGYFHFWSPHEPYFPTPEFTGLFRDGRRAVEKPEHPFAPAYLHTAQQLTQLQTAYDQYIANVDAEFGRLMDSMSAAGMLENTCVIVLADHGQLFERGVHGHASRLLYEGVLRTPLLIRLPGQTRRVDVRTPTSNVDLLPTLASIMGVASDLQTDGQLLPGLGGVEVPQRSLFSVNAAENSAFLPLTTGAFALIKGTRKFLLYTGYAGLDDRAELYDLAEDPDELRDLSRADPAAAKQMRDELLAARDAADRAVLSADRK
ncbi:MAG: Choline-sulfatase [Anaerolineales bacterium]|nr:Choline-sulfatase [Anaerolineales bacterium]